MKQLILILFLLCTPFVIAESSYTLDFYKIINEPLDNPILFNRVIELTEVTSNSSANIKIDNNQYEITDEYKDIEGLRIKVEEALPIVRLKNKNTGDIYEGQYAKIKFEQTTSKEWNYVLYEGDELNYKNHNIKLKLVGTTEDNQNAITLEVDNKAYGFIEGDEQLYNGIIITADNIVLGRNIKTQENIKAAKISITDDITLENYPLFFTNSDQSLTVITPKNAPSYYSIAATGIVLSLPNVENQFDNEITNYNQNFISVGCNELTKKYTSCTTEPGKGIIKLFKDNDHFILVLLGYGENELLAATNALKSKMKGTEITIDTTPSEVPEAETIEKAKEDIKKEIEKQEQIKIKEEPKVEILEVKPEPLEEPKILIATPEKSVLTRFIEWIKNLFSFLF